MPSSDSHQDTDIVAPPDQARGQVVPLPTARVQMENPSRSQDRATSSEPLVKMIPVPPPQLTQDELDALSRRLRESELSSA